VILQGRGPKGSLRRAVLDAGLPAVIYEAGEPLRFEENEIALGVQGVR
jgi:predicted deacylase